MFDETGGLWKQVAGLQGWDRSTNDQFGTSVALSGATIVVGAPTCGCAFVFGSLGSMLRPGEGLIVGAFLQSVGGQFRLVMQRDGNLVLYSSNRALWQSHTANNPGSLARMQQRDGNLVIYSASGRALWQTHTYFNPGASAVLQRDGNFVVYSASGRALWSSGT